MSTTIPTAPTFSEMWGNSASTGALTASGTTLGNITTTGITYYPSYPSYGYSYVYPNNESRVVALEAEVKVLREMLAAVLSGRDLPTPARKRTK